MLDFVAASRGQPVLESQDDACAAPSLKEEKRALRQEEAALRDERRAVRQQQRVEDAAWQTLKSERQAAKSGASEHSSSERKAQADQWRALRRQRKETLAARQEANQVWQHKRLAFRQRWSQLPIVTIIDPENWTTS